MTATPPDSSTPQLTPVRSAHQFDETALGNYLSEQLGAGFTDASIRQFEGGQSNPTFLLDSTAGQFVLRKKPPGVLLKSAHAVDREYRVITALADTPVVVPATHLLCEDESVIDTAFFVMDYVPGRVFIDPNLPELTPEERGALYDHFLEQMAALHAVDYEAVGLGDFGRPGNYFSRQISRWSKQYAASQTEDRPEMDSLLAWLEAHTPESDEASLVHGDYRIGNCIVHPTEPKVVAILDWELSTIGHPLGDLAYAAMMHHRGIALEPVSAAGIPSEGAMVDRYCELAGRPPIENWRFYVAYNLFRTACILQGVYKRGLDGNASSEHWRDYGERAKQVAIGAWRLVDDSPKS